MEEPSSSVLQDFFLEELYRLEVELNSRFFKEGNKLIWVVGAKQIDIFDI